jgi:hypothetical protein
MGYIENNLMSGEKAIYRTKKHWIVYWPVVVFVLAVFAMPSACGIRGETGSSIVRIVEAVLSLIVGSIWGLLTFANIKNSEYVVTNKRVSGLRVRVWVIFFIFISPATYKSVFLTSDIPHPLNHKPFSVSP